MVQGSEEAQHQEALHTQAANAIAAAKAAQAELIAARQHLQDALVLPGALSNRAFATTMSELMRCQQDVEVDCSATGDCSPLVATCPAAVCSQTSNGRLLSRTSLTHAACIQSSHN